jgi:hypothetical protein
MKKLLITLLAALGIASAALAQNTQYALTSITAGTAANVSAYPIDVVQLTFTASTTNNTTVKFYDSNTTTTNIVRAAYGRLITYSTNWTATYLDPQGVTITNTFVGQFTTPSSVAAVTNTRPVLASFVVPASSQRIFTVSLHTASGFTADASANGILETTYSPR